MKMTKYDTHDCRWATTETKRRAFGEEQRNAHFRRWQMDLHLVRLGRSCTYFVSIPSRCISFRPIGTSSKV